MRRGLQRQGDHFIDLRPAHRRDPRGPRFIAQEPRHPFALKAFLRGLVAAGLGVAAIPRSLVAKDLQAGSLVQVLPDLDLWAPGIFAVWPDNVAPESLVLRFVHFMADQMKMAGQTQLSQKNARSAQT